jgi:hypothetical protein
MYVMMLYPHALCALSITAVFIKVRNREKNITVPYYKSGPQNPEACVASDD